MLRIAVRCLLLVALAATAVAAPSASAFAASKTGAASASKSKNSIHQFTGIITALDKQSLTVEKGGKKPMTRTFVRHEEMSVVGDLARDVKVTVYYREDGGKLVARRVVVKEPKEETAAR